jgi:hypothetical protein
MAAEKSGKNPETSLAHHPNIKQSLSSVVWCFIMVETRNTPRYRVAKPAKIDHGGDKIACIIRDISATGAAIELTDLVRVPAEFTLILPEERLRLPCHVVWRTEYRIGVAFD